MKPEVNITSNHVDIEAFDVANSNKTTIFNLDDDSLI